MLPAITIFGHDIGSYSICAAIGIFMAALYEYFSLRGRKDLDDVQLINTAAVAGMGAFIGAHLLFAVTKLQTLFSAIVNYRQTFSSLISFLQTFIDIFGGMVFYGGLIGGFITGIYYLTHLKHIHPDPILYADAYAPAIPLFHVFGRIGCFLSGCCYGMECKWGFMYHNAPSPEANDVTRLPIQLIEATGNLIIFFILHRLSKKPLKKGILFASYILMYSVMRFTLEFFRGDTVRGFLIGLSTSQWISIILFTIAAVSFIRINRNIKESAE